MTTNEKGAIGLSNVILNVTENQYQSFLPLTDTTIIDLIIMDKNLNVKKLQVKYIKLNKDGSLMLQLESVVNGKRILKDFSRVDAFAVYCPDNKLVYYIPTNEIKSNTFTIKVTETKNGNKPLRLAANYLDINKIF